MIEMGLKDDVEDGQDDDDEDADDDGEDEEGNSDEEKYTVLDNFEGFANSEHHGILKSDTSSASAEDKLKQMERLGYSPRTIQAAARHPALNPQQSTSPEAIVSEESKNGKLGSMQYSSSEGVLNRRSKKSVAWENGGTVYHKLFDLIKEAFLKITWSFKVDKEKDSQAQSAEARSLLQSIAQQQQKKVILQTEHQNYSYNLT